MKLIMLEGSPEEISEVMRNVQLTGVASVVAKASAQSEPIAAPMSRDGPDKFVTTEFAHAVLSRRPLSDPMKAVLRSLYHAHPDWVASTELRRVSGYSVQQFSGLMGAFARRMAHTDAFDESAHFFDYEWDEETDSWNYRLPESVREALRGTRFL